MIGAFFQKLRFPFGRRGRPNHRPDEPDAEALKAALALEIAKRRSSDSALNETRAALDESRDTLDQTRAALDESRAALNESRVAAENERRAAKDEARRLRDDILQAQQKRGDTEARLTETEALLKGAEALKDAVIAAALDAVLTIDGDGKITGMNPAAETMFGVKEDDARGKSPEEIVVPPESRAKHRHGLNHFLSAIDSRILGQRIELPALRSGGREFPAEVFILPAGSGPRRFFVAHVRDLTKRKNAEQGIRQARSDRGTLAALLRLPLGSASFDQIGEKALSLVFAGRGATLGTDGAIFLVDDLSGELKPSARRGRGAIPRDTTAQRLCAQAARNNEIVLADGLYCLPIRGDNKALGILALSVSQDYRPAEEEERFLLSIAGILAPAIGRVRAEEALRRAIAHHERAIEEKAAAFAQEADRIRREADQARTAQEAAARAVRVRSTLLANTSHDLRTALNAVIGFSGVLLHHAKDDFEPSRYRSYVEYIHESGQRLLGLIRGALELSRAEDDAPAIGPDDGVRFGCYAVHSAAGRRDRDLAEALFQRAIAVDPGNAIVLENYSVFRTALRKDHERMDELYRRAIEAEPGDPLILGSYAMFLADVRTLDDQADKAFIRALAACPDHAPTLAAYAGFVARTCQDHGRAESLFQRALAADPGNSAILCDYGVFAWTIRGDNDRADASLRKAVEIDPRAAAPRAAYAAYLLERGDTEKGVALLDEAIPGLPDETRLRALFLKYAHGKSDDARTGALAEMRDLLARWVRCPNLDRSREVRGLGDIGHPHPELLAALIRVIAARDDMDALDRFPAWASVARWDSGPEAKKGPSREDRIEIQIPAEGRPSTGLGAAIRS